VGDDEYEGQIDAEEKKKDLGALEAAKMAIKFLDQVGLPLAPRTEHHRSRALAAAQTGADRSCIPVLA
jgi:hypothetical protein